MKERDEEIRRKYNRKLLKNGFKTEFKKRLKYIIDTDNKELNFFEFLLKHIFIVFAGMIPLVIDFIKTKRIEQDTCIVSLLAILLLLFCCWRVSSIRL